MNLLTKILTSLFGKRAKPAPQEPVIDGTHMPLKARVFVQEKLRRLGLNPAVKDYAEFPPAVVQAVRDYQSIRGLYLDGIVGPQTFGALRKEPDELVVSHETAKSGMPWYDTAKKFVGLSEIVGPQHNPIILEMFKSVGHDIKNDETAWCAAFVGHCLEKNGIRSTRKLLARSYTDFGTARADYDKGCIVVMTRGEEAWQGHVGFATGKETLDKVEILGGNQSNAVSYRWYDKAKVIAIRWPE